METYKFRGFRIPEHMMGGLQRYINQGVEPGDFLFAVLAGKDLVRVCENADQENLHNLPAYASYLYNKMPASAWGSEEKVWAYMARKQAEQRAKNEHD
jgi:hypothetical protein